MDKKAETFISRPCSKESYRERDALDAPDAKGSVPLVGGAG